MKNIYVLVVKCGLAEIWQANYRNVIRRVFGIHRKKLRIFRRRYIVGMLTNMILVAAVCCLGHVKNYD